jgi:hypothetical protein
MYRVLLCGSVPKIRDHPEGATHKDIQWPSAGAESPGWSFETREQRRKICVVSA